MDIHISNLDPMTSHKTLKKQLKKKLLGYGITSFDCNKPRGKPFAFITVPDIKAAELFLRDHAQRGKLFLSRPLIVKRGHKQPDARHVEGLQSRARDAVARPPSGSTAKATTVATSCGVCTYDSHGQLVYQPEWEDRRTGAVVLGKRATTIANPKYLPETAQQTTLFRISHHTVELIIADGRSHAPSLTMILSEAPRAFHLPRKSVDLHAILMELTLSEDVGKPLRVRGADPHQEKLFSTCLVYRVELVADSWPLVQSYLRQKSAHVPSTHYYTLRKVSSPMSIPARKEVLLQQLKSSGLSFAIKFQLQRLVYNGYLLPAAVGALINIVENRLKAPHANHMEHALRAFSRLTPYPGPDEPAERFSIKVLAERLEESLEHVQEFSPSHVTLANQYEHLYLVHRAIVTPAGVYLYGPELEPANRVLRQYASFASTHFLRVNFRDEDGDSIRYDRNNSLKHIHDVWFKDVLENGILVAGQLFSFLGFSNSSLKDQSCWFMAPFTKDGEHFDAWGVVKKLGDFSHLHAPAKCAARIGQAFSDTPGGAVDLTSTIVTEIRDVERGSYCFSDGCGTVSRALLQKIWSTYKRNCRPTLFQIRWSGAKGMISLDNRLEGAQLNIRPSMLKFRSQHNSLEICNAARRPLPFYLNRQLVKILEDLDVPDATFHDLQSKAVSALRTAIASPRQAAAFLDRKDIGKGCNLSWLIERLDDIGVDARDDVFLQWALEHATLMELRMMKHKARIPVSNGWTLFGIMDETGFLQENEIFCRVDRKVKTGQVAVTRSPALHPGDIQVVTAVEVPPYSALMALDNCVVFSMHGKRDLASQLSGGDLDGDIFNISFDRNLMPRKVYKPADYSRPQPIDLFRTMEKKDITDWFIRFMQNDQLARIAITHVQLSDKYPEGTLHPDCITLAALHSTAVDFQKTGIPVDMKNFPKFKNLKPHFMAPDPRLLTDMDQPMGFEENEYIESDDEEGVDAAMNPDSGKNRSLYYHSNRILGQLYDKIDESAFLREIDAALPTPKGYSAVKELWSYIQPRIHGIQHEHMTDFAWGVREEYEEIVQDLMIEYGSTPRDPLSEIEVFMGSIIGKGGALPSRRTREEARTMKDHFNDSVTYITRRIVHGAVDALSEVEFGTEADWFDTTEARDQALERSIACLAVALEEGTKWPGLKYRELKSFRYIAGMVALREVTIFERRNDSHYQGLEVLRL